MILSASPDVLYYRNNVENRIDREREGGRVPFDIFNNRSNDF